MSNDFFLVSFTRGTNSDGRPTVTIHIGWGVIWLVAAVFSVLVMVP